MWDMAGPVVVAALAAYFLGNLNGAVTVSTLLDKDDVRSHGSGNAGMTNYMRSYGLQKTGLVVLIDLGKALLACFMGGFLLSPWGYSLEGTLLSGFFVSLGHDCPVALGFRGGKGALCGLGVALAADWRIGAIILGVFLLAVVLTRYVSLGSCLAAVAFGLCVTLFYPGRWVVTVLGWLIALTVLIMHRGNLKRLFSGTERKLSFGQKEGRK